MSTRKPPNPVEQWRSGWRTDVLKVRSGCLFEAPTMQPVDQKLRCSLRTAEEAECVDEVELELARSRWDAANKWWDEVCGKPKWVLAPMVAQSEVCFRLLCRCEGVGLCYTPMYLADRVNLGVHDIELGIPRVTLNGTADPPLHSGPNNDPLPLDRPLVCQLAGNDCAAIVRAGLRVQGAVDAIDLNFGCPQICAENAMIGAYLLENKPEIALNIVTELARALSIPVLVKMRIQPGGMEPTVRLARRLQWAGASVVTLHGRLRWQREHEGPADWTVIREVKAALHVPVIANGSVQCLADAQSCLACTGVDAVMSGTGLLRHPTLFSDPTLGSPTAASTSERCVSRHAAYKAILNCYSYLNIVERCSARAGTCVTDGVEAAAANGRSGGEVVGMHLMAMLQVHVMDTHRQLCARLVSRSQSSAAQLRVTLGLIADQLLGERVGGVDTETCVKVSPGTHGKCGMCGIKEPVSVPVSVSVSVTAVVESDSSTSNEGEGQASCLLCRFRYGIGG